MITYCLNVLGILMPCLFQPPPPPPWYQPPPPQYERERPRPRRPRDDDVEPPAYRGDDDTRAAPQAAALHPPANKPKRTFPVFEVQLTEADYEARKHLTFKQQPPDEFDHLVVGVVTVIQHDTEAALRAVCGLNPEGTLVGCAVRTIYGGAPDETCRIHLGPEQAILAGGLTRNLVLRHEAAHCNGWGGDHAGIR
jgi:hypothetical protein